MLVLGDRMAQPLQFFGAESTLLDSRNIRPQMIKPHHRRNDNLYTRIMRDRIEYNVGEHSVIHRA